VLPLLKNNLCKNISPAKKSKIVWVSNPGPFTLPLDHRVTYYSLPLVSTIYFSLIEKHFIRKNKPVLNQTLTLTLVCVLSIIMTFTVCMEVSFWWVWDELGLARLRWDARFACSNPSSLQTHQKLTFIQLVCLIVDRVTGELLGRIPTIKTKMHSVPNG